jgi:hypothetical protein
MDLNLERNLRYLLITLATLAILAGLLYVASPFISLALFSPQLERQTAEAKLNLATLYMAEIESMNQFKTYSTCLDLESFGVKLDPNRKFAVGFTKKNELIDKKLGLKCQEGNYNFPSDHWNKSFTELLAKLKEKVPAIEATVSADGQHFKLLAVGEIDGGSKTYLEAWTLDDQKNVVNVYSEWRFIK